MKVNFGKNDNLAHVDKQLNLQFIVNKEKIKLQFFV